jgi:Predicted soluble lytic transglycosylase fused to an ABC-type amino acid-binding protein
MLRALAVLFALMVPVAGHAQDVPANAKQYLPILRGIQVEKWPDAPIPSFLAAQVEKESCITLRHSRCWNPRAELKTSREYGFGFGQITRAYRADGSIRFDKFSELKREFASLRDWSWDNRYDPHYQLLALVEMDRSIFGRVRDAATPIDRLAFTLSAYNGGESGVLQDRRLCSNTTGCDPSRWFSNVERTSLKSRKPSPGYGQSFFDINRGYVREIIYVRRAKYEPYFLE